MTINFSGGSRISRGGRGHGPLTWALFGENVCKNKRIGSHGGVCAGHAPLDPPMNLLSQHYASHIAQGTENIRY